jgi:hypothetical protein
MAVVTGCVSIDGGGAEGSVDDFSGDAIKAVSGATRWGVGCGASASAGAVAVDLS